MAGVNKIHLLGHLGKDPEVRHLEGGRAVANFSIATSETYNKKDGEKVTNTEWHNVVLWSPLAEIAEKYLKKGNQVYIEGKMTTRSYDDKDGVTRYISEVVGRDMTLLSGNNNQSADSANNSPIGETEEVEADDLPFIITLLIASGLMLQTLPF